MIMGFDGRFGEAFFEVYFSIVKIINHLEGKYCQDLKCYLIVAFIRDDYLIACYFIDLMGLNLKQQDSIYSYNGYLFKTAEKN